MPPPSVHLQQNLIDAHVGRQIRKRRTELGLTQEKLGDLIGVTFQQVQKYEKGVNRVRTSRLLQIANVLDTAPAYFFDGAEVKVGAPDQLEGMAEVEDSLGSPEGKSLNEAFARIANPEVRKGIIYLVKKLALEQSGE